MSGNYPGTYHAAVTLTSAHTIVTFSGTVDGLGVVGVYGIPGHNNTITTKTISGGVIGTQGTAFTVNSSGVIDVHGSIAANLGNYGIVLATPGTVNNSGTVQGDGGLAMLNFPGVGGSGLLINGGQVLGRNGVGVFINYGTALNSGNILGFDTGLQIHAADATVTNSSTGTILSSIASGIQLDSGGIVFNAGMVSGLTAGMSFGQNGTVTNTGTVSQTGTTAGLCTLNFFQGGVANNTGLGAAINAANDGIDASHGLLTVNNDGTINAGMGSGVVLGAGGAVFNNGVLRGGTGAGFSGFGVLSNNYVTVFNGDTAHTGALLTGRQDGIDVTSSFLASTVANFGTVASSNGDGVFVSGLANISNGTALDTGALIEGEFFGVAVTGLASLVNFGTIETLYNDSPSRAGVYLGGDGVFTNYGYVAGYQAVVMSGSDCTMVNEGTLSGGSFGFGSIGPAAMVFDSDATAATEKLVVAPGAKFNGKVIVVTANSGATLEFTFSAPTPGLHTAAPGVLDGIGSQITGFNTLAFDAGSQWEISGDTAGLASGQLITGFAAGDVITLDSVASTSFSYSAATGLELFDGSLAATLDIAGTYAPDSFLISSDGTNTTIALCYLRGTGILTPFGEVPVESLQCGDLVVTRTCGVQPVKWIGRQSYHARFLAKNPDKIPVCIHPGALAPYQPLAPLFVSPGHALLLGETLVMAKNLVNGVTVTQDSMPALVEYFAIELAAHDCVLANGAYGESFADGPGLRRQFHNAAEFDRLFPDYRAPEEIALYRPRPERGPALGEALAPVAARAAQAVTAGPLRGYIDLIGADGMVEGWAQDIANPLLPVLLSVMAGAETLGEVLACDHRADLAQAGIGRGYHMFAFALPNGVDPDLVEVFRTADGSALPRSESCRPRLKLMA